MKVHQRYIDMLHKGLLLVLVVYAAWLSAHLLWFVLGEDASKTLTMTRFSATTEGQRDVPKREIARFHLFGSEQVKTAPTVQQVKEAPKTRLRLTLKGVFTSEHSSESGAIVEEQGRFADYYRVGDELPGKAILAEVFSDRILLRRNGQLEALYFEDGAAGGVNRLSPSPVAEQQAAQEVIETPEEFMEEATRRLADNPQQALNSVGLSPAADGGYVYRGNNPMLSGLNLKQGDIIRSVNGHTLGDIQKDKQLMSTLYEQGMLEVEVVREGASFYINYPLR